MTTNLPEKNQAAQAPATEAPRATIRSMLEGDLFKQQLAKALPKHLTTERFIRVAITAMNKTPMLAQCDQASFFNALLTLSQFGLEPDGRRAHLIPFNNKSKNIVECQLIVDYKGIVELIQNANEGIKIHADVVCENDEFEYDRGEIVKHRIDYRKPRGAMYAAYVMFRFGDGSEKVEIMSREEIDAIRKRSKAADFGPWKTDYNEMAKKTVLRRGSKWIRLSPETRDAIEADDIAIEFETHVPAGKTTGKNLLDRVATASQPALEQPPVVTEVNATEPQGEAPINASPGKLEGLKLAVWESVASMAGGDVLEMCKIVTNLSGGKVNNQAELESADDAIVKEMSAKIGGRK